MRWFKVRMQHFIAMSFAYGFPQCLKMAGSPLAERPRGHHGDTSVFAGKY